MMYEYKSCNGPGCQLGDYFHMHSLPLHLHFNQARSPSTDHWWRKYSTVHRSKTEDLDSTCMHPPPLLKPLGSSC